MSIIHEYTKHELRDVHKTLHRQPKTNIYRKQSTALTGWEIKGGG